MADEGGQSGVVAWEPPGPGQWFLLRDHMPKPVSRLFAELFPMMAAGSEMGAARYGFPVVHHRQAIVNCWMYFGGAEPVPLDATADDVAAATLRDAAWRDEPERWASEERPRAVAGNLALQDENVGPDAMPSSGLADHLERAIAHYGSVAPLHFAHMGGALAVGELLEAAEGWGIEADELLPLFAGASPASTEPRDHVSAIASALLGDGVAAVGSLDDVFASPAAGRLLSEYLRSYGWRLLENRDLVDPTLAERPSLVVATINAALGSGPFASALSRGGADADADAEVAAVRERVPVSERSRFDELLGWARAGYAVRDDDEGVCFLWPLGLIRRAVLEAERRLSVELFDASVAEIVALLRGSAGGPDAAELASRSDARRRAASLAPPRVLGSADAADDVVAEPPPLPPNVARLVALRQRRWSGHAVIDEGALPAAGVLRGLGVGRAVSYRGIARCVTDGVDALDRLSPGDVIVAIATTPGFNAVFPIAGAVVTEEGGVLCHAAVLARELGLPGVVGVSGIEAIRDGDVVEVDAAAGIVRIV